MATHYDIVRCAEVASTQDVANERFTETEDPVLVVASRQVRGRGRQGRAWVEPDRGLFSSLAFTSEWTGADTTLIPLVAAVAVADAIEAEASVVVDLKWPNDLLIDGKKVGGILVEAAGARVTVGCGVNLWWASPPPFASAVFEEDPEHGVAERLATGWADRFLDIASGASSHWPRDAYVSRCVTLGSAVTWDSGSGIARRIGFDGSLIVDTDEGEIEVRQGDVHLSGDG